MAHTKRTRGTRGRGRRIGSADVPKLTPFEFDGFPGEEGLVSFEENPWAEAIFLTTDDYHLARQVATIMKPVYDKWPEEAAEILRKLCYEGDFMESPASTRFHLSEPGGLAKHSASVTVAAVEMMSADTEQARLAREELGPDWREITIVTALFHDACKANFYKKLDETAPSGAKYGIADDRRGDMRHGDLSAFLVRRAFWDKLPRIAYDAIELHMGRFDYRRVDQKDRKYNYLPKNERPRYPGRVASRDAREYYRMLQKRSSNNPFVHIIHEADLASSKRGL